MRYVSSTNSVPVNLSSAKPISAGWAGIVIPRRTQVDYSYRLVRRDCESNREIEVVDGKTSDTNLEPDLPRSTAGAWPPRQR